MNNLPIIAGIWIVTLVASVFLLENIGISVSTAGTIGFIVASIITIIIWLNGNQRRQRQDTPDTWYWDGRARKCRYCKSGYPVNRPKAIFNSKQDAANFAAQKRWSNRKPQTPYQCPHNSTLWHLSTTR